jgi:hypothetical protein
VEKCQIDAYNFLNYGGKFITCYQATCQAIWLRNFISGLVIMDTIAKPRKIFCDNSTFLSFSWNTRSSSRS